MPHTIRVSLMLRVVLIGLPLAVMSSAMGCSSTPFIASTAAAGSSGASGAGAGGSSAGGAMSNAGGSNATAGSSGASAMSAGGNAGAMSVGGNAGAVSMGGNAGAMSAGGSATAGGAAGVAGASAMGGSNGAAGAAGGVSVACTGQPGCVDEFVGSYQATGKTDASGTDARFTTITGITGDGDDTLWVTDGNAIRSITISTKTVTTLPGDYGSLQGIVYVKTTPPFLLVSDATHFVVRRIDPTNQMPAGVFSGTLDKSGMTDGNGTTTYASPGALGWVAGSGRYFIVDGDRVRFFFNSGGASTIMPAASTGVLKAPSAVLCEPTNSAMTYTATITETGGNDLLTFDAPSGPVMPWTADMTCGSGKASFGDGACATATFDGPRGLARKAPGTVLVADTNNNRVREVTIPGGATTVTGDGSSGHVLDVGTASQLDHPTVLFYRDATNDLFIVDASGTEILRQTF